MEILSVMGPVGAKSVWLRRVPCSRVFFVQTLNCSYTLTVKFSHFMMFIFSDIEQTLKITMTV